jgi:hypothetical protein
MKRLRSPFTIKPAGIISEKPHLFKEILTVLESVGLFLRSLAIGIFLIIISVAIGIYSYRFFNSPPTSFVDAMNMIFKEAPPTIPSIAYVGLSGLIYSLMFYGGYIRDLAVGTQSSIGGLTKFIAGITIIIWVDIFIFGTDSLLGFLFGTFSTYIFEIVFSQIIALVMIMILFPLFKQMVKILRIDFHPPKIDEKKLKALNSVRYYGLSFLMIMIVTFLVSSRYSDHTVSSINGIQIPVVHVGIFLASFGIVMLFYRPPKSLGLSTSFSFTGLFLGVGAFVGVGILYGNILDVQSYLFYVGIAIALTILSYFVLAILC